MQHHYKVATIIVTYNGAQWIEKCLTYLFAGSLKTVVIVVDNCSTDNTIALLQPFTGEIMLIRNDENLGFGAANNIGIRKAIELGVDYVFLLNQDVYIGVDCISTLLHAAKAFPRFGILSPLQLDDTGKQLDTAFKKNLLRSISTMPVLDFHSKVENTSKPINVRFINAATWLIPVHVIKQVGLFHPVFYHYGEDNHYSSRTQYFKYQVGVVARASAIHDREQRANNQKYYLQALRTVPLFMLLDIRKPFLVAYLLGLLKLRRFRNKLRKLAGNQFDPIYEEQKKWFYERIDKAKAIRSESKQPGQL